MRGVGKLYDCNQEFLKAIEITKLNIKEHLIVERSIKDFHDDSPCVIHRRACSIRILFELKELIENKHKDLIGKVVNVNDLYDDIKKVLDFDKEIKYIQFL